MSLPNDDIPRPSMVVVRSRLNFRETDVPALGEILGLPLQQSVTAAQVARRLERIALEYVIGFAIEHERSSAQQTAAWCERLGRARGLGREPFQAAVAAHPSDARLALMLNPDSDLASPPDSLERRAREAARYWRSQPKRDKGQNRRKPENFVLLARLVETFAWAFGAPRPARYAHHDNRVFKAAGKFIDWLANTTECAVTTKLAAEKEPERAYMEAFHRKADIGKRAARYLRHFKPKTMASLWRHHGG